MSSWNPLIEKYDHFLVDVWGVLMDGTQQFPKAVEFLTELGNAEKEVVLISNTPDRASHLNSILENLHIPTESLKDIITSGEATIRYLARPDVNLGSRFYKIGHDRHDNLLDNQGSHKCSIDDNIDFLLATSFDNSFSSDKVLKFFASRQVPMLCVNPDISITKLNGMVKYCAGELARRYSAHGGEVVFVGKPYPLIFDIAIECFSSTDKRKIIMIGDNPQTDILGAYNYGIDQALVNSSLSDANATYFIQHFTQAA